jgi:hypothetical protein
MAKARTGYTVYKVAGSGTTDRFPPLWCGHRHKTTEFADLCCMNLRAADPESTYKVVTVKSDPTTASWLVANGYDVRGDHHEGDHHEV